MRRTGSCKQCGNCCKDLVIDLHVGGMTDYEFTDYIRWLDGHEGIQAGIKNFKTRDVELQIKSRCKHLIANGDGTFACDVQDSKPDICKRYPEQDYSDDISRECGFKFIA
jgi:Fe-S-cluster containining protein